MILYITNIFQLFPIVLSYQYDLILLAVLFYLFIKNIKKKIPITFLFFILIFMFIILVRIIFFYGEDIILPKFYRDLRPFIVLLILYYIKLNFFNLNKIYIFFALMIFLLTLPNLLAIPNIFFNQLQNDWYMQFTQLWSNESTVVQSFYLKHGVSIPVAGIAAIGQRFSSFFYMPAVAGINFILFFLFYIYYCLLIIYYKKFELRFIFLNLILLSLIYFNGTTSGSSVFEWGIYLIPLLILFFVLNNYYKIFMVVIGLMSCVFFMQIYPDTFFKYFNGITGNRYSTSDITTLLPYLTFFEIVFGLFYIPEFAEPKAFGGDSAILSKILQGGILYYIVYISCLYKLAFSILKLNIGNFKISKPFFNSSCCLILFCETGFPATSQPLGTTIYFTLIILGSIFIEKTFKNKE